jgi:hypothetical protein
MKLVNLSVALAAIAAACACAPADAARVGIFVGAGVPYYVPAAPVQYYYPPVVAVPTPPVNYVAVTPQASSPGVGSALSSVPWYYCDASKAYYPYVKECLGGWRPVAPPPSTTN